MTRINANVDPKNLTRVHLVAELREITMVPAALKRSLRTKNPDAILKSIPKKFTMGTGHVKFFYDKIWFLQKRFNALCDEMEARGYTPDRDRSIAFKYWNPMWCNDWKADSSDNALVMERINLRISEKPHLYR
jgi:deoxyribonuclease (pyrimidine dimer)